MAGAVYLADTSVYVLRRQNDKVNSRVTDLVAHGRIAVCQMMAIEYFNNASNPSQYGTMRDALYGQRWMDVTTETMDRALDVHRLLAQRSRHFSFPDLVIAATAEVNGATVLHYDSDYDRIAEVTGQPTEWVVPKGSI